jgi:hypothetical protein
MSIPLVQEATKDAINTSIIAIKRNIERINMLLGLVDNDSPDLSGFATKQELQDAVTELQPVDEVTVGNMQSVTSNAVYKVLDGYRLKYKQIIGTTNFVGTLYKGNSNITGNECIVFANCISHNDYMYSVGYHATNGTWLKVVNYDYSPIGDTYVVYDILYFERNV